MKTKRINRHDSSLLKVHPAIPIVWIQLGILFFILFLVYGSLPLPRNIMIPDTKPVYQDENLETYVFQQELPMPDTIYCTENAIDNVVGFIFNYKWQASRFYIQVYDQQTMEYLYTFEYRENKRSAGLPFFQMETGKIVVSYSSIEKSYYFNSEGQLLETLPLEANRNIEYFYLPKLFTDIEICDLEYSGLYMEQTIAPFADEETLNVWDEQGNHLFQRQLFWDSRRSTIPVFLWIIWILVPIVTVSTGVLWLYRMQKAKPRH